MNKIKYIWRKIFGRPNWVYDQPINAEQKIYECPVCGAHLLTDPSEFSEEFNGGCEFCKGVKTPTIKIEMDTPKAVKKKSTGKKTGKKKSTGKKTGKKKSAGKKTGKKKTAVKKTGKKK